MKSALKSLVAALLEVEARLVLAKYRPRVIAVTGSVGKTTTKDAIYALLANSFFVRKSEKSFNSEIGIPLTVLGCPNGWMNPIVWGKTFFEGLALILLKNHYPKVLVLEIGADRPGDIKNVSRWVRPDVVVVTRIPDVPVHVEFFDSPEALADEKAYLVRALSSSGTLIVNVDDERVRNFRALHTGKTLTFGFDSKADVVASHYAPRYDGGKVNGIQFRVDYRGASVPVAINGVLGRQHVYPALAALTVALAEGVNLVSAVQELGRFVPPPGRMRILEGKSSVTVLDDTYNSSPAALEEAVRALGEVTVSGKKVAVLGDMLELGKDSATEHRRIGALVAATCALLVTVGIRAKGFAEGALAAGLAEENILSFEDSRTAACAVPTLLAEGDLVLVKGSQSTRTERVVSELVREQNRKAELLVRQEPEWLKR